ncbi:permease prefix domain 1-containing protein [Micromonospora sp. SH-82]|uniref:permease prefix domain 1-containing protein n=1 Tax=Micromonospora sp. SH-82 TaxID=3132938 RepID=UPI003EC01DA5
MSSLTDRYLAATLESVPAGRRPEISAELRASIADAVDDRVGAGADHRSAEREVLTELGDPQRLAARYADQRLQLIGPAYYLTWRNLLRQLLTYVPAIVGTVVGLVNVFDGDGFGAIGPAVATALSVAVHICFWVTLGFAIMERTGETRYLTRWTVDDLPEATVERQITLTDTISSVVVLLFTVSVAFFPWQQLRVDGEPMALLDPDLWGFWLPVILGVLIATIVFEFVKYRVGHWNWGLVVVNALLGLAFTVPVIWLLLTERLLNPDLVARFEWLREGGNLDTLTVVTVVVLVAITAWDVVDSIVKAHRHRR